jgi:hypothetical protein
VESLQAAVREVIGGLISRVRTGDWVIQESGHAENARIETHQTIFL